METKLHRLEAAVEYLKNRGLIHRQKDIAIAMNASPATISGASPSIRRGEVVIFAEFSI